MHCHLITPKNKFFCHIIFLIKNSHYIQQIILGLNKQCILINNIVFYSELLLKY